MAAGAIVERFDGIEDVGPGEIADLVDAFLDPLLLQARENDSTMALAQQLPRRLMLGSRLWTAQKRRQSSLPSSTRSGRFAIRRISSN